MDTCLHVLCFCYQTYFGYLHCWFVVKSTRFPSNETLSADVSWEHGIAFMELFCCSRRLQRQQAQAAERTKELQKAQNETRQQRSQRHHMQKLANRQDKQDGCFDFDFDFDKQEVPWF